MDVGRVRAFSPRGQVTYAARVSGREVTTPMSEDFVFDEAAPRAAVVIGDNEYAYRSAIALARRDLRVGVIVDNAPDDETYQGLVRSGLVSEYCCSFTDVSGAKNAIDSMAVQFGRLDILVNGVLEEDHAAPWRVSEEEFIYQERIDMKLPFFVFQASVPYMRKGGGGRVINFSSVLSEYSDGITNPLLGMFKAGVNSMSRQWAVDLCNEHIVVTSLWIGSDDHACLPSPDEVPNLVSFLALDATVFINGTQLAVDRGASVLRQGARLPLIGTSR